MTVLQVIATAGGLLEFAKSREISVVRVEHGQSLSLRFDYDAVTKSREKTSRNFEVKPGDTIVVP
jgi:protein involved in polysaccharide export with SLBB domain